MWPANRTICASITSSIYLILRWVPLNDIIHSISHRLTDGCFDGGNGSDCACGVCLVRGCVRLCECVRACDWWWRWRMANVIKNPQSDPWVWYNGINNWHMYQGPFILELIRNWSLTVARFPNHFKLVLLHGPTHRKRSCALCPVINLSITVLWTIKPPIRCSGWAQQVIWLMSMLYLRCENWH